MTLIKIKNYSIKIPVRISSLDSFELFNLEDIEDSADEKNNTAEGGEEGVLGSIAEEEEDSEESDEDAVVPEGRIEDAKETTRTENVLANDVKKTRETLKFINSETVVTNLKMNKYVFYFAFFDKINLG